MAMQVVSLVEPIVHSFRGLRLAQSFSKDFNSCLVQIDLSCLRLITWHRFRSPQTCEDDPRALKSLERIKSALDSAKELYDDYQTKKPEDVESQLNAPQTIQGGTCDAAVELHERIHAQINENASSIKKTNIFSWLLYKRGEFDNIVTTTRSMVDQLVSEFPIDHQRLSDERYRLVNSTETSGQLNILSNAAEEVDKHLYSAVKHRISSVPDSEYGQVTIKQDSRNETVGSDFTRTGQVPKGGVLKLRFDHVTSSGNRSCIGARY